VRLWQSKQKGKSFCNNRKTFNYNYSNCSKALLIRRK
jgi:hypothetical protein